MTLMWIYNEKLGSWFHAAGLRHGNPPSQMPSDEETDAMLATLEKQSRDVRPEAFSDFPCDHRSNVREEIVDVPGGCCGSPTIPIGIEIADCSLHGRCDLHGRSGATSCFGCENRTINGTLVR